MTHLRSLGIEPTSATFPGQRIASWTVHFMKKTMSKSLQDALQFERHWHVAFLCQAVSSWESQGETCSDININVIYHAI